MQSADNDTKLQTVTTTDDNEKNSGVSTSTKKKMMKKKNNNNNNNNNINNNDGEGKEAQDPKFSWKERLATFVFGESSSDRQS
jgi:hypothetical protein